MAFFNPFARKARSAADATARIKDWVRSSLSLPDDVVVSVNQLSCTATGCADVETVIGVLRPGQPAQTLRLLRPIAIVTERDVAEVCRPPRPTDPPAASRASDGGTDT